MKTLEELRQYISPVPSLFAKGADAISPAAETSEELYFFEEGFPPKYAQKEIEEGTEPNYLLRNNFNRFGEIASREIHFRESGGLHTYNTTIPKTLDGYPQDGVLNAYDGIMLTRVESTTPSNAVNFNNGNGISRDDIIDVPITGNAGKKVYWRTANKIFGVEEGLFSLTLDYTRAQKVTNGTIIQEDSFIIGAYDYMIKGKLAKESCTVNASTPLGSSSLSVNLKGLSGDSNSWLPFILTNGYVIQVVYLPLFGHIAGSTNFFFSFFAKKGSTFSGRVDGLSDAPAVIWTAIPIVPKVVETTND